MKPKFYHKNLVNGEWEKLSFAEQMANIGSEIERTINWQKKDKLDYSQTAFFRALELVDFTIDANVKYSSRLRELCRMREMLVDYFFSDNKYNSTIESWQKYFQTFAWKASLDSGR